MILVGVNWPAVSLENYRQLLGDGIYATVLIVTLKVAAYVTVSTLIVGYPIAYYLSKLCGAGLALALAFVLLPFWTSVLVRNYAWLALLGRQGILNSALLSAGIIEYPLPLMFNMTAVVIGMTYVLMPFMILSLFSVMRTINPLHLRASAGLGASRLETFWRIFFPLSLPGVYAGSLLVFITAMGFFITPALLGGGRVPMIAVLIESQVRGVLNFGIGSAMGTLLLVVVLAIYYIFDRLLVVEHLFARGH